MQKWEYFIIIVDHRRDTARYGGDMREVGINNFLDVLGAKRWELVSAVACGESDDQSRLYFKRPLDENPKP